MNAYSGHGQHDNRSIPSQGKHVLSSAPGAGPSSLDLNAARSLANTAAQGGPSDQDPDDGVTSGGWTNGNDVGQVFPGSDAV